MKLRQRLAEHIELHHPLPWDLMDSGGRVVIRKGSVIDDPRERETLARRGLYVDDALVDRAEAAPHRTLSETDPFWQWENVYQRLTLSLRESGPDPNFLNSITQIAGDIETLTEKDSDASLFVVARLNATRYAIAHSLQTALIAWMLARRMGMKASERNTLLKAALTMNIGMIELQKVLHEQEAPLTPDQKEAIRMHPIRGWQRLESLGVTDQTWLRAVAEHHETPDGKGYPGGRTMISPLAEVIHFADRYCAMIVGRAKRKAMPANRVARELFVAATSSGSKIGPLVVKEFGIYPPGNFVRLANGDVAIVIRRGSAVNSPVVSVIEDRTGYRYSEPVRRDTSVAEYAVTEVVAPEDVRCEVNPTRLYGYRR